MPDKELDCTNMPCPQPVLKCKRCVEDESPERLVAVVDNAPARDNVARFLGTKGYTVEAAQDGPNWRLTATSQGAAPKQPNEQLGEQPKPAEKAPKDQFRIVVFLTCDRMGRGDDELGTKLMHNFLATLPELGDSLWRLVMVNSAVRLACKGHDDLPALQALAGQGVDILVCGTCLDHFGLLESKEIGQTTNMLDVVTSLQLADKVIQL